MDRPAAAIKLDDHTLNRLAPVGVTQLAECTDLKQIGRAWRQVFHRNCLIALAIVIDANVYELPAL